MRNRTYTELSRFERFIERYRYLRLKGEVGSSTFGFDRYLNQGFYSSREWKRVRDLVIVRDDGCDLGIPGYEIHSELLVHHMNPVTPDDIRHGNEDMLNPDFLVTTCQKTHNAIHFGNEKLLRQELVVRRPNDTKLW